MGTLQWKLATAANTGKQNYFPMLTRLRFRSRNRALCSSGSNKAEKKEQRQQLSINGKGAARFSPLFSAFFKTFPHLIPVATLPAPSHQRPVPRAPFSLQHPPVGGAQLSALGGSGFFSTCHSRWSAHLPHPERGEHFSFSSHQFWRSGMALPTNYQINSCKREGIAVC